MKYTVNVTRTFSAAHALRGYKGRCERLHGHNWKVRVALYGTRLDKTGMLLDFTDLRAITGDILSSLDHCYINEVPPFTKINPTAENIAAYVFTNLKKRVPRGVSVAEVEVWESDTSSAIVTA